jgi:PAS domain-containing protein
MIQLRAVIISLIFIKEFIIGEFANMESKIKLTTKILITGILIFLLLLLTSGFIGLYTLKNSYIKTSHYIEAVSLARESQVYFQNQFYFWNNIILQGEDFSKYQDNYHSFTRYSDKVQDTLFNLKLLCSNFKEIPDEITELRLSHKQITMEYMIFIEKLVESNFRIKKQILISSKWKDEIAISEMNNLVTKIEDAAGREIKRINNYYFSLALAAFVLLSISVVLMGIYIAKKILTIHEELETRINERTQEITKANADLKAEILERIKTEKLLITAKEQTEETNTRLSVSEKKYRHLVENSNDIIFSLDENWNFISTNKAIRTHLKINPDNIISQNFIKLLDNGTNGRAIANQLTREKLEAFSRDREPISFIAQFSSSFASEPKEMNVKLEYIKVEEINEIHGIISTIIEDNLLKYFVLERQKYEIGNYLTVVDDITYNIVKNLKKYMDHTEVSFIRIGLREMIINAIEHGNLEIMYEEKTDALMNDTYRELIEERRNRSSSADRKVTIEYQIDPDRAVFKITDDGKGFDHKKALDKDVYEQNKNGIPHGRGIMMSKEIFDEIKYNETGNQVLLMKLF